MALATNAAGTENAIPKSSTRKYQLSKHCDESERLQLARSGLIFHRPRWPSTRLRAGPQLGSNPVFRSLRAYNREGVLK